MDTNDHAPLAPELQEPLAALRTALAAQEAPRGVEKELMAAFAKQHARRRWHQALAPRQWRIAGGLGALAAAVVVVLALALHSPAGTGGGAAGMLNHDDGAFFIALESLERIEREPNPRMIQAELPRTELAGYGVPVTPENAGDTVRAEMLVSADGQPLALRLTSFE